MSGRVLISYPANFGELPDQSLWDHVTQRHDGRLYRFEDSATHYGATVYLRELRVIKQTAKGAWIDDCGSKRFVLFDSWKKYACLSKIEALESFKARKRKQIKIVRAQLRHAENALREAEQIRPEYLLDKKDEEQL